MADYLLFHAATTEEVHQCAYALLKHLDVYNLKPPPNLSIVIYTTQPALLEAYDTFYNSFELEIVDKEKSAMDCLRDFCSNYTGQVLFLGGNTYPIKELEPLFADIEGGQVYADNYDPAGRSLLGFRAASANAAATAMTAPFKKPNGYLAHYTGLSEFNGLLKEFFTRYQEESVPNQVKLMHPINAAAIQADKARFLQHSFPSRFLKKLLGKGWRISNYQSKG